jgi:hypothetical protein
VVERGANEVGGEGEVVLEKAYETFKRIALIMRHFVHKFGLSPIIRDPLTSFGLIVIDLALTTPTRMPPSRLVGEEVVVRRRKEKVGRRFMIEWLRKKSNKVALEWWKAGYTGR